MAKRGGGYQRHSKVVWPGFSEVETRHIKKVGRNELCPCGAGKKYKDCHEKDGETYLRKLADERDSARVKELRQRLREQGVPWYRRMFVR